jgi:hypothetical protein
MSYGHPCRHYRDEVANKPAEEIMGYHCFCVQASVCLYRMSAELIR